MNSKAPTPKPEVKAAPAQDVEKTPVASAAPAKPALATAPSAPAKPTAVAAPSAPEKAAAAPAKPAVADAKPAPAPSAASSKPAAPIPAPAPKPAPAPAAVAPVAKAEISAPIPAPTPATAPVKKAATIAAKTPKQTSPAIKQKTVEKAIPPMQQFDKAIPAMMKGYDDFTAFNQATLDAFMKASNVLVKGYEDIGKEYFKFAQASAEASAEAAKSMMAAKTLKEVVDVQSGYARSSFDTMVAEGTKLNEMSVKVANEAIQPIQTQFTKTMERVFKAPVAA